MNDQQQLVDDLNSGIPARVESALADLEQRWRERREIQLPPPEPGVLEAFLPIADSEVVLDYMSVIGSYRAFQPPLTPAEVARRWIIAQLEYGDGVTGLKIALAARNATVPEFSATFLIRLIASRKIDPRRATVGAAGLLRHLLDSDATYDETVAALTVLADHVELRPAMMEVVPWIAPDDRRRLDLNPDIG